MPIPLGPPTRNIVANLGTGTAGQGSSPNLQPALSPQSTASGGTLNQGGYTLGGAPSGQAQEEHNTAVRSSIASAFAPVLAGYQGQLTDLGAQRDNQTGVVERQYAGDRAGLDQGFAHGNENLDRSQGQVDYTRSTSLRQLGDNLHSALDSRLRQIGSLGGGSSSAGLQLSQALHDTGSTQRGGLIDEAQIQTGNIGVQRKQLGEDHTLAQNQLDIWKTNQIAQISSSYQTQKSAIERAMAGANVQQQQALNQMSTDLARQAAAQLSQVQGVAIGAPDTSAARTAASAAGSRLAADSQFQVQPLSSPELNLGGYNSGQPVDNGNLAYSPRRRQY